MLRVIELQQQELKKRGEGVEARAIDIANTFSAAVTSFEQVGSLRPISLDPMQSQDPSPDFCNAHRPLGRAHWHPEQRILNLESRVEAEIVGLRKDVQRSMETVCSKSVRLRSVESLTSVHRIAGAGVGSKRGHQRYTTLPT